MHDSPEDISTGLSHDTREYLLKAEPAVDIKVAVDFVMQGDLYLCSGATTSLRPRTTESRESLTSCEQTNLLRAC